MKNKQIHSWWLAAAVLLLALLPFSAEAAEPYLVKDINVYTLGSRAAPGFMDTAVALGSIYYFSANNGINGTELWRSDGTAAGTVMVKDINAGANSSYPSYLTNVNGTLYFTASNGTNGTELWRSDGTETGTILVKDIVLGGGSSLISSFPEPPLTNVNGTLYFLAHNGTNGYELWRSDGTEAGTILVKDIALGSSSSFMSTLSPCLTDLNGLLYFVANDGTTGY